MNTFKKQFKKLSLNHTPAGLFRLTLKIIKFNHKPQTARSLKPTSAHFGGPNILMEMCTTTQTSSLLQMLSLHTTSLTQEHHAYSGEPLLRGNNSLYPMIVHLSVNCRDISGDTEHFPWSWRCLTLSQSSQLTALCPGPLLHLGNRAEECQRILFHC